MFLTVLLYLSLHEYLILPTSIGSTPAKHRCRISEPHAVSRHTRILSKTLVLLRLLRSTHHLASLPRLHFRRSLQRCALLHVKYQPEGRVTIEVVSVQTLAPQKAQPFVQLQRRLVCNLCLQHNLIRVARSHGIDGHAHKFRRDSLAAVRFADGEHSNVAAEGAAAVGLEFADDDADELVRAV